jgi:cytochrome bd ubiquinol oxidase subunit II
MSLQATWFVLICGLWSAYFVTEGFDFGVGMLVPVLARTEEDRAAMFASIGPVWDGNEVWLLIAGGATFAAFPQWYATMFSGFYIALLAILVLLIVRVVSFEWRTKSAHAAWRGLWTWVNVLASYGAPLFWGIGLASLLYGTPIAANQEFTGSFWSLFSVYSVLAGLAVVALFALHGAVYLGLRGRDDAVRARAQALAFRLAVPAALLGAAFLVATLIVGVTRNHQGVGGGLVVLVLGVVAVLTALVCTWQRRPALAFGATAATIVLAVVMLFVELYPRVMVSSSAFANSLTVHNAASGHYTLTVMTVATVLLLPIVFAYQFWTYRVFRVRVTGETSVTPGDILAPRGGRPPDPPRGGARPDA